MNDNNDVQQGGGGGNDAQDGRPEVTVLPGAEAGVKYIATIVFTIGDGTREKYKLTARDNKEYKLEIFVGDAQVGRLLVFAPQHVQGDAYNGTKCPTLKEHFTSRGLKAKKGDANAPTEVRRQYVLIFLKSILKEDVFNKAWGHGSPALYELTSDGMKQGPDGQKVKLSPLLPSNWQTGAVIFRSLEEAESRLRDAKETVDNVGTALFRVTGQVEGAADGAAAGAAP